MTQPDGPNAVGHKNAVTATITALSDMISRRVELPPLGADVRLDGKNVLVTGANSGLGRATAIRLAKRGAHITMACRPGHEAALEDVKQSSRSDNVELADVDLSDLEHVSGFCDRLRDRAARFDITIFNAGLMPVRARHTPQGYEVMFAVHFLSSRLIVDRFLQDGIMKMTADEGSRPRIIFVSSEAHRSSKPIDFDNFGAFVDYGVKDGMAEYGRSKLHLCTYASELSDRLNGGDEISICVHSLCPGPIASNIAREAPGWLKPLVGPLMRALFRSPVRAVEPVLLLAADPGMGNRSGAYLHMMRERSVSDLASNRKNRKLLWEKSADLLNPFLTAR